MANTLTELTPTLFSAAKEVANEPAGMLDAINLNFDNKGVAYGDSVTVPVAPAATAADFTAANVPPAGSDKTAAAIDVSITAMKKTSWHLTGEQIRSLQNAKSDKEWAKQLIMQGMRTLRNLAEVAAWTAAYKGASRAVGTAGTTPFASNIDILADLQKVFRDNGAPMSDMSLVLDSAAVAALQKLDIYQQAQQAGTAEDRRNGRLPRQFGFQLLDSAGISTHTIGTENGSYVLNDSGSAKSDTTISLDTGSGTIVAGDVITNQETGRDSNNYVVNTALASGDLVIGAPGLLTAWTDGDSVENTSANYVPNVALERNAVVGVMRPPLIPANPTIKQQLISDPYGLTYLLLEIAQYGQVSWELHLAYGFKAINYEFIALLMG